MDRERKQKKEEEEEEDLNSRKEQKSEQPEVTANRETEREDQDEDNEEEEFQGQIPGVRGNLLQMLLSSMRNQPGRTSDLQTLVNSMKKKELIKSKEIEEAFLKLPRDHFVTADSIPEAFDDNPIRLNKYLFNVSAPHMYAICLENLGIQPGHVVLDVGSGCGLFTCMSGFLAGPKGKAVGVDLRQDIIDFSEANKKKVAEKFSLDLSNVTFFVRNCFLPTAKNELYDRIHVGACCPEAKLDFFIALLKPGGIMVTPYADRILKIEKSADGKSNTQTKLMAVRYGDLIIPSDAEIVAAKKQIEKEKSTTVLISENPFRKQMEKLINNPEIADTIFLVEDKKVYAHKTILAARSEFFRAMLFNGMKESDSNSKNHEIPLKTIHYATFIDCLHYIYLGDIDIKDADHAIELLQAANYVKLDHLKSVCEKVIAGNIEIETAAYSLGIAAMTESWQLKSFCLSFILENFDEVSKTKAFEDLSKPLLLEITKAASKFFKSM